jgi:hypothetical protein
MPTARQRKFCFFLADGLSPVESARRAGYARPSQEAWKLMHRPRRVRDLVMRRALEGAAKSLPNAVRGAVADQRRTQWAGLLSLIFEGI